MMRYFIFLLFFFINSQFVLCQNSENIQKLSSFFPKEKAHVLVVGTFHFDYPNLDVNKTNNEDKHSTTTIRKFPRI